VDRAQELAFELMKTTPEGQRAPMLCLIGWLDWLKGKASFAARYFKLALDDVPVSGSRNCSPNSSTADSSPTSPGTRPPPTPRPHGPKQPPGRTPHRGPATPAPWSRPWVVAAGGLPRCAPPAAGNAARAKPLCQPTRRNHG
jgi:hypothetical protein